MIRKLDALIGRFRSGTRTTHPCGSSALRNRQLRIERIDDRCLLSALLASAPDTQAQQNLVLEGGYVTLDGSFSDRGELDAFALVFDWGYVESASGGTTNGYDSTLRRWIAT